MGPRSVRDSQILGQGRSGSSFRKLLKGREDTVDRVPFFSGKPSERCAIPNLLSACSPTFSYRRIPDPDCTDHTDLQSVKGGSHLVHLPFYPDHPDHSDHSDHPDQRRFEIFGCSARLRDVSLLQGWEWPIQPRPDGFLRPVENFAKDFAKYGSK